MSKKEYQKPEVLSGTTICEPVETGCCLRSCGGSPKHMPSDALVSTETTQKFESATKE